MKIINKRVREYMYMHKLILD